MIEIRNVSKRYDDTVIFQDVSLNIDKGDRVVIIGESGCGKSTLLRCINGLNKVDSGEIILNGKDITKPGVDMNEVRKKIGRVYQQLNLFPEDTDTSKSQAIATPVPADDQRPPVTVTWNLWHGCKKVT